MGFLREKKIKGHKYIYWCSRVRSRKKYGGTGKVKSPDLLIGKDNVFGKYLPFYLYKKEVPLREYAMAVIADFAEYTKIVELVTTEIIWGHTPKVQMRSKNKGVDVRRQSWRRIKEILQEYIEDIIYQSSSIQESINVASYYLAKYEASTQKAQINRDKLKDYLKNPGKTWTKWESVKDDTTREWHRKEVTYYWLENADSILDENITACEKNASRYWERYQNTLERIVDYAPRQRQEEFKRTALGQIEKQAGDPRWVERYELKLESEN